MGYKSKFESAPFGAGGAGTTSSIEGNLYVDGTISASLYIGDGSGLTGITASATGTWSPAGGGDIYYDGGNAALGKNSPDAGIIFDVVGNVHVAGDTTITGSTKFGTLPTDTHILTGSMWVSGNIGSHRPWLGNDSGSGLGVGGEQQPVQSIGPYFTFYVDPIAGSDYNNGETVGTALKTVKKACELVPMALEDKYGGIDCDYNDWMNCAGASAVVYCLSGTHVWPSTMWGQNFTRFVGATSSLGSMTSPAWTVISASKADGSIIEASFLPATYAEDELRGTFVHLSGAQETGWIYANESSSMPSGATRLYIAKGSYGLVGPEYFLSGDGLVSSSLELINFDTKFQSHRYFDTHQISHGNYPAFKNIHFVNSSSTNEATFTIANCHNVVLYANKWGDHNDPNNAFVRFHVVDSEVFLRDSYFAFGDPDTPSKLAHRSLSVDTNGFLAIERACVIDKGRLTTFMDTSRLYINSEVVFRDVTSSLWSNADKLAPVVHKGPSTINCHTARGIFRFLEFTGSTTCWKGVESNRQSKASYGGTMELPLMYGAVESEYSVIAQDGVRVQINPNSSVSSSLGINKFSADGGLSETAQDNYFTMITGTVDIAGSLPLEATGFVQYATGSTILGNQVTDTHQVTGALILSGGSDLAGIDAALIDLQGLNPVIKNRTGHLHMYSEGILYLGCRATDKVAIGRPYPDEDLFTTAISPILVSIHDSPPGRSVSISGSMSWKARESFTANGTASAYIQIIGADSTAGSFGIALPSATGSEGQVLLVKDEGGNCSAENITITTFAAETIDGGVTVLLDNDYESVNLYSNGANWFIW